MIEIIGLTPRAPQGLRPLDLRLAAGEVVALTGPSGAGKTSMARAIAGLDPAASGMVRLDGQPLGPPRRGAAHPVQYLYQEAASALDPLWRVGRILEETGARPADIAAAGVDPAWRSLRPAALSGGQAARVVLARALGAAPRLLICDEITAALDPVAQAKIWHSLCDLAKARGIALLVISHDAALRARIAAREIAIL